MLPNFSSICARVGLPVGLLALTALALLFRLPDLGSVPPGLYGDEAWNGVDALRSLNQGWWQIIYPGNFGREGGMIWLQAISLHLFGISIESLRLPAALVGALTVPALALFARELCLWLGQDKRIATLIGLFAGAALAVSFWHVNFSRIAFRAILDPLIFCSGSALLIHAFRTTNWRPTNHAGPTVWWKPAPRWRQSRRAILIATLAGLVLGSGLYGYPAYRLLALPVIGLILIRIWKNGQSWRLRWQRGSDDSVLASCIIGALVTAAPIVLLWADDPSLLVARQDMAIWAKPDPWAEFLTSSSKLASMYLGQGDMLWRHNYAGDPALGPAMQVPFIGGLILLAVGLVISRTRAICAMLLLWGLAAHLPAALTWGDPPHMLRSLNAVAWAATICALPLAALLRIFKGRKQMIRLVICMGCLTIAYTGVKTHDRYFNDWPAQAGTAREFMQAENRMLDQVITEAQAGATILILADVNTPETLYWRWALQVPLFRFAAATQGNPDLADHLLILPQSAPWTDNLPTPPSRILTIDPLPAQRRAELTQYYPEALWQTY
ncbi:MAG: hypothetical protein Alpg2KO_28530 [Alphaproteobacteria bacterium]